MDLARLGGALCAGRVCTTSSWDKSLAFSLLFRDNSAPELRYPLVSVGGGHVLDSRGRENPSHTPADFT